jgi:glutamate 5-kinase
VLPLARRVVVKIGSSSLTGDNGLLDLAALRGLVDVLAARHGRDTQIVLVTSGAVAAGLGPLGLTARPSDIATAQAAASVGQGILVGRYAEAFASHTIRVGQVLLTAEDTVRRRRYKNAQRALTRLLDLGVIPIVNENDAVTTAELKFGDNDRLAALVSHLVGAEALVLLTDVDGLHDKSPRQPDAQRIAYVGDLADVADVPISAHGSTVGTGGMVTKIESVRIATGSGIPVVLTAASNIAAALDGDDVGTFFAATAARVSPRLAWLEHSAQVRGRLILDDGAVHAICDGHASLLPAGITAVDGDFDAGDPVELVSTDGAVIARGLVAFDSADLPKLLGRHTDWLRNHFGEGYDRAVIHRDNLVLTGG